MKKGWLNAGLAVMLAAAMMMGACGSAGEETESAAETTVGETAVETTDAAETEASESTETAADEEAEATEVPMPDFSAGLTEDGGLEDASLADLVTLPENYQTMTLSAADLEVTEEEIQEQIDALLANYPVTKEITDREVADGDTVNIDYVGSVDGVEFSGGSTQGAGTDVTIGVTSYIDDFLEQLIGHKPGDTFDVNVTFPDPYENNPDLAGKDAVFVTTINYIVEEEDPELTDEFVTENLKDDYGYESVEDVKAKITDTLQANKNYAAVWNKLIDESVFSENPDSLTDIQLQIYVDYTAKQADNYGMTLDDYLTATGMESLEAFRESYRESAERIARQYIITQKISEEMGIEITDEDLTEYFGEENLSLYKDFYGTGYMRMNLKMSRIPDLLVETAVIDE